MLHLQMRDPNQAHLASIQNANQKYYRDSAPKSLQDHSTYNYNSYFYPHQHYQNQASSQLNGIEANASFHGYSHYLNSLNSDFSQISSIENKEKLPSDLAMIPNIKYFEHPYHSSELHLSRNLNHNQNFQSNTNHTGNGLIPDANNIAPKEFKLQNLQNLNQHAFPLASTQFPFSYSKTDNSFQHEIENFCNQNSFNSELLAANKTFNHIRKELKRKAKDLLEPTVDLNQPNVTTIMQKPVDMGETKIYKRKNSTDLEKKRVFICNYDGKQKHIVFYFVQLSIITN
jgi:hypothetical protein